MTDASLLLGYLNPDGLGRGTLRLNREAALDAFQPLGRRLQLDVVEVALGVHRVVNAAMADRIRLVSIKRGVDPRRYTLVAFGGAGPLHGSALLADLPIRAVLIPARPGVLSAIGLAWGATEHDSQVAIHERLENLTASRIQDELNHLDRAGRQILADEGVVENVVAEAVAAVRYAGQSYELDVPLGRSDRVVEAIGADFQRIHDRVYGYANPGLPVDVVSLRLTHRRRGVTPESLVGPSGNGLPYGRRDAFFSDCRNAVDTPIYWRDDLAIDQIIPGPAIVEQEDATTVVYPDQRLRRLSTGGLLIDREEER